MNTKKVLLIIPEMTMGGAQRSMAKLSIELAKYHRVWLLVFNEMNIAYPYGGELLSLDVAPKKGIVGKALSFLSRVSRVKALKTKLQIDISISFLEGADYINILSKRKEKVIISIRGSKQHDENMLKTLYYLRTKVLIPKLYRRADWIVTVNKGIADELLTAFRINETRIKTIYNFDDVDEIRNLANQKKTQ